MHVSVLHSTLSERDLLGYVFTHYSLAKDDNFRCFFLEKGCNDTYLIKGENNRFILRVYHAEWRTPSQVAFEMEALQWFLVQGASVSQPIERRDGALLGVIGAPEGERIVVMFSYAEGAPAEFGALESEECVSYGRAVADLHNRARGFLALSPRFSLDEEHLITNPLRLIEPHLRDRVKDWKFLREFADLLKARIGELDQEGLTKGLCHGDAHGGNAHCDQSGTVTFFDFDCCGIGWLAYDIAVFLWAARIKEKHLQRSGEFLSGYESVRPISSTEKAALPVLIAMRDIWITGTTISNGGKNGHRWAMNSRYFDIHMARWKYMRDECFPISSV